jgi:hypothetical protein
MRSPWPIVVMAWLVGSVSYLAWPDPTLQGFAVASTGSFFAALIGAAFAGRFL